MIRRAGIKDIDGILALLSEVLEVHAKIRPDLFISGKTKYERAELESLLLNDKRPVYVSENEGSIEGYCFCIVKEPENVPCMYPRKTLYIDDLCVDENKRGRHIGKKLYEYVLGEAKKIGCYNVTLNVWEGNDSARKFYDSMGLKPKKTEMEIVL